MNDMPQKIAAGLERAFVAHGFAATSVELLRDASGVSLRTLYKYYPSRDDMVLAALEHRHRRYLAQIFAELPEGRGALDLVLQRIGEWMRDEASHGCLFHAAVAAAPDDPRLHALLARHKAELAHRAAAQSGLAGQEVALSLLCDGLMQSWPLYGAEAVRAAQRLAVALSG